MMSLYCNHLFYTTKITRTMPYCTTPPLLKNRAPRCQEISNRLHCLSKHIFFTYMLMALLLCPSIVSAVMEETDNVWEGSAVTASETMEHPLHEQVFSGVFATWHLLDQGLLQQPHKYRNGAYILCTKVQDNFSGSSDIAAMLFKAKNGEEDKDKIFFISAKYLDTSPDSPQQDDTLYFELSMRSENGKEVSHKIPVPHKNDDVSLSLTMQNTPYFTETAHYVLVKDKTPFIRITIACSCNEAGCVSLYTGDHKHCSFATDDINFPLFFGPTLNLFHQGRYASWLPSSDLFETYTDPTALLGRLEEYVTRLGVMCPVFAYCAEIKEGFLSGGGTHNIACIFRGKGLPVIWLHASIQTTPLEQQQGVCCALRASIEQTPEKRENSVQCTAPVNEGLIRPDASQLTELGQKSFPACLIEHPSFGFHISVQNFFTQECATFTWPKDHDSINITCDQYGFSITKQNNGHTQTLLSI